MTPAGEASDTRSGGGQGQIDDRPTSGAVDGGSSDGAETAEGGGPVDGGWRAMVYRAGDWARHPVVASMVLAAVLHLLWVAFIANSGGDLAAQDAWAEFTLQHPGSAYNLAWYGGMHPVSYSVLSPYAMAALGVRTTMIIAGTVSAGLVALLLIRSRAVRRPLWPSLYGTFALICNAVSGRVTFGLGMMFGLAAVAVIFAWPRRWRSTKWTHKAARFLLAAVLAALTTMSSPVAGLFVGVVAAALWFSRRRPAAYALGVTPAIVVGLSAWLFPFSGKQPMNVWSAILPFLTGLAVLLFSPPRWRTVRIGAGLYALGVLLAWLIPSQIGTNITRLGMLFGGVVLLAALPSYRRPRTPRWRAAGRKWVALVTAIAAITVWQGVKSVDDVINTTPTAAWARELAPLLEQLDRVDANRGRVEVVPASSHVEAAKLVDHVNLARGWNRQADLERNPLFYEDTLYASDYHAWLDRWAVHYVVLPAGKLDGAGENEAELITQGLPYLQELWSDANWRLFKVRDPTPVADPPATVLRAGADSLTLKVSKAGPVLIRIPYSPWLSLVDKDGKSLDPPKAEHEDAPPINLNGCLTKQVQPTDEGEPEDEWTVLHAPYAGTYYIGAPYKLPRGTPCPHELDE